MKALDLPELTARQIEYHRFLQSDEWQETKKEVLTAHRARCHICGTVTITEPHHIKYTNDLCDQKNLIPLCRECHKVTHDWLDKLDFFLKINAKQEGRNAIITISLWNSFVSHTMFNYYINSWIRHEDTNAFFRKDNMRRLCDFIKLQVITKYPMLKAKSNYESDYTYDISVHNSGEDQIKNYVAECVSAIRYSYPNISSESLQQHFKMSNGAWKTISGLANKIDKEYKIMKALNFDGVQATNGGEFPRVTPGGYVIGIVSVQDVPEKEYLKISYDIAEGEFKNYYYDMKQRTGYDLPVMYKSYKDKALGFFKAFLDAVAASNPGYTWNNDERTLTRKLVGCVLREEEYRNRDGEIKVSLKPEVFYPAADIRAGKFEALPKKTLTGGTMQGMANAPAVMPTTTPAAPAQPAQDAFADMEIFGDDGVPF